MTPPRWLANVTARGLLASAYVLAAWPMAASSARASAPAWGEPGAELAAMRSAPVRAITGAAVCSAAPAAHGWHTAGHCLRYLGPLSIDGETVTGQSLDPWRDLGHLATGAAPPLIPMASVPIGATVEARPWDGATIRAEYIRARSCRVERTPRWASAIVQHDPAEHVAGGWPCAQVCVREGRPFRAGDSGTGLWFDGTVWAVLVAADTTAPPWSGVPCGADQLAVVVTVP